MTGPAKPFASTDPARRGPLASESEIQASYQGRDTAQSYVEQRFTSELTRLLHERQVAEVNRVMRRHRPRTTLEIAPGPGRLTREIEPAGALVCLEYNQGMIEEGRAACRNGARWVRGNAFELPFAGQFDFVYSFRFIRHFKEDDRHRLYEQVHRVLKSGGRFMMDAVNERVSAPLRAANPDDYPIYDELYRDDEQLRGELRQAGFEVERLEPVQRWYNLQYKAQVLLGPRSRLLCRTAIRALERLRRGPALEWIVTCTRS